MLYLRGLSKETAGFTCDVPSTESNNTPSAKSEVFFTALRFPPQEAYVATGDSEGRIRFWYFTQAPTMDGKLVSSLRHWHSSAVSALDFSEDGAQLFSGGKEAVIVNWHLRQDRNSFLPRMGAGIACLAHSPDRSMYAVGLEDNSLYILSTTNDQVVQFIQGLKIGMKASAPAAGMVPHALTSSVAVEGSQGAVQFFDPIHSRSVLEFEVVRRPQISTSINAAMPGFSIAHIAFSADTSAQWLATIDYRQANQEADSAWGIKFWLWDEHQKTCVD